MCFIGFLHSLNFRFSKKGYNYACTRHLKWGPFAFSRTLQKINTFMAFLIFLHVLPIEAPLCDHSVQSTKACLKASEKYVCLSVINFQMNIQFEPFWNKNKKKGAGVMWATLWLPLTCSKEINKSKVRFPIKPRIPTLSHSSILYFNDSFKLDYFNFLELKVVPAPFTT